MKLSQIFIVALWLMIAAVVPAYAHEHEHSAATTVTNDAGAVLTQHALSLHEKIDEFLLAAPEHNYFAAALETKKAEDILLDVRNAAVFQKNPVAGAVNIPVATLHKQVRNLDKSHKTYVVGTNPEEAAYAVFLLRIHGVDAWVAQSDAHSGSHHLH
jgi:rhodanese-related sulfurtransferase